jgi:Carboxypeptidase regulatory-like domain
MIDAPVYLLIAVVSANTPATTAHVRGTLCFERTRAIDLNADCVTVEGTTIEVEPAEEKRRFLWLDERRTEVVFGVVAPAADTVNVRGDDLAEVPTSFAGSDPSVWPVPVTIAVTGSGETYKATLPASVMLSLKRVRLPHGRYLFELSAPHHHPVSRNFVTGPDAALGPIVFRRYPRVSGRVRDRSNGAPIAGAAVELLPSNAVFATTDAGGAFSDYVSSEWPKSIRIRAPGFGTRVEQLPKTESDASLPDIQLSRGGSVRVRLTGVSEATLRLRSRRSETVAEHRLAAAEEHVFADLEAGDYLLMAEGDEPLQKFAKRTAVKQGEVTDVAVDIAPVALEVSVRSSGEPVPQARLRLQHEEMQWEGTAVTGERGAAMAELWQQGRFAVLVQVPAATTPFFLEATLTGAEKISWTAELPKRSIVGEVVDERRSPVANAAVSLETESDAGGRGHARTTTDAAGRFELSFVEPGMQIVRVTAPQYLMDVRRFQLPESAQKHTLSIVLQRAAHARIHVTDPRGVPIAGCAVIHSLHVQPLVTDESGAVSVPLKTGERKVVYFLPRTGSFAAASVAAQARPQEDPIRVVIAPGEVTLVVRTRTTAGDALPNVAIAMRVNGYPVPPAVMEQMAILQGLEISTGPTGFAAMRNLPAGVYELWPYFSYKEGMDIFHGVGPEPPVRLLARPGENTATLTFAAETR